MGDEKLLEGFAKGEPHCVVSQAGVSNGDLKTENLLAQCLDRQGNT